MVGIKHGEFYFRPVTLDTYALPPTLPPPIQDMACQCRARMMSPGVSITMESDIALVMMSLLYQILLFKQCLCLFRVPQWAFVLEKAQPIKGSSWLNVCVCIWKALNQVNVDRSLLLAELKTRSALSSPLLPPLLPFTRWANHKTDWIIVRFPSNFTFCLESIHNTRAISDYSF